MKRGIEVRHTKISIYMDGAYSVFFPESKTQIGGAEVNLANLAIEIAKDPNYVVNVYVADYNQENIIKHNNVLIKKIKYLNPIFYNKFYYKIFRQFNLIKTILTDDSDILITSTASELVGKIVLIGKFIKRKKVIYRLAHDNDTNFEYWKRNRGTKFLYLYKFGFKNCDYLIAQSENQEKKIQELKLTHYKKIKNGFVVKNTNDIIDDKKYILWVGRAVHFKQPQLFVDLAKECPEENFLMILPSSPDKSYTKIRNNIIKSAKEVINLEIIDYVEFDKIALYYQNAKLFVNTSTKEGFPNTFIQSGLAKTPILSFNVDPDDIIKTYNLGFVCNNNLEEAKIFIKNLNNNTIKTLGENLFSYIEINHNITEKANEYKMVFRELLGR